MQAINYIKSSQQLVCDNVKMADVTYDKETTVRLDSYLSSIFPDLSRSYLTKQIYSGLISVNDVLAKPSQKLKSGDKVSYPEQAVKFPKPKSISLPIIYEDDFCIVIDKPNGVITHAKGVLNDEGSVASFIQDKLQADLTGNRAGIVHRLDRGTSGVIVAGKSAFAVKYLQRQFAKRQTKKTYLAIVSGRMSRKEALINMPIERNPKKPSTFRVGPNGKTSETAYEVIAENEKYSLLKLQPKTGRTHQLRVHLKAIGHPIVGDELYDGEPAERLMLHAQELEFIIPDVGRSKFNSPLPKVFQRYVKAA